MDPFGDPPRPKTGDEGLPRKLDRLSIDGLEDYIGELEYRDRARAPGDRQQAGLQQRRRANLQELIPARPPLQAGHAEAWRRGGIEAAAKALAAACGEIAGAAHHPHRTLGPAP